MSQEEVKEKKGNKATYVVIGLLVIGMAGFGTDQFGLGSPFSSNSAMSAGEVELSFDQYLNGLNAVKQQNTNLTDEQANEIALDLMGKQISMTNYVEEYPLGASKDELVKIVQNNIAFFENGKYSPEAFNRLVPNAEAYLKSISAGYATTKLQNTIKDTAIISETEKSPILQLSTLENDVLIAKIDRKDFDATIESSEVETYYNDNQFDLLTDEQVAIKYIHFNPNELIEAVELSDAELTGLAKSAYEADYYLIRDQESADAIYNKVSAGESLSEVIKSFTDKIEDQGELGEIETVATDDSLLSQQAIDAIYSLSQVGDITKPTVVDDGIYLFELSNKVDQEVSDAQKTSLAKALKSKKAQQKIDEVNSKLNTLVYEENKTDLAEIAAEIGLQVEETSLEKLAQPTTKILSIPTLVESIKNSDKALDKLQDPVNTEDNQVVLYQLTDYKAPVTKTLDEASDEIKTFLKEKAITEKMNTKADEVLSLAKKEGFKTALDAQSIDSELFERFNKTVFEGKFKENSIVDLFSAYLIAQKAPNIGDDKIEKIAGANGDVYLYSSVDVRLKDVSELSDQEKAQREAILSSLKERNGNSELQLFTQLVRDNTDVEVNARISDVIEQQQATEKDNAQ